MLLLRRPTVRDVPTMMELMAPHITAERLLPRSAREVAERLRDYMVAVREESGSQRLVGLASVSLVDTHLAEIGALTATEAEAEERLIEAVLEEVRDMGVERAFVMTDDGSPYARQGFRRTDLESLPEKRDRQCLRCARLPRCRQEAFEIQLSGVAAAAAK